MMVGSWYFMLTRSDWCYTSVYHAFLERNKKSIAEQQKFSFEKLDML